MDPDTIAQALSSLNTSFDTAMRRFDAVIAEIKSGKPADPAVASPPDETTARINNAIQQLAQIANTFGQVAANLAQASTQAASAPALSFPSWLPGAAAHGGLWAYVATLLTQVPVTGGVLQTLVPVIAGVSGSGAIGIVQKLIGTLAKVAR